MAQTAAGGWKGLKGERTEDVDHASGRRIAEILRTPASELSDSDYAHLQKVVGLTGRHLDPEPGNLVTSRCTIRS